MTGEPIHLEAIEARANAATEGPWERGDRQHVAGVNPEFGDGKCAYCKRHGEPTWVGRRDINGTRMPAHVHESAESWFEHGIYALRADGSVIVVNDTDEYGYMNPADAEFIAHAREDVPTLVDEVRRLQEQRDAARAEVMAELLDARRRAEQAEAKVTRVEALAAEWQRLGRGDGIHGRQLRAAINGRDGDE